MPTPTHLSLGQQARHFCTSALLDSFQLVSRSVSHYLSGNDSTADNTAAHQACYGTTVILCPLVSTLLLHGSGRLIQQALSLRLVLIVRQSA